MKCDKCKKNEANFHSITNINGEVKEKHLCLSCAENEKEFNDRNFFNDFNLNTSSFIEDMMSDFKSSFSYFTNPMLDFDIIDDDFFNVNPIKINTKQNKENLEKLNKISEEEKKKLEIKKLEIDLKKAVVEERYEDAIVLRDKIKKLKANN